jgi:hypothetical protein
VEFNRANTDSQDIPIHTELVMTKSALEFLLGVRHEADELVDALLPLVPERPAENRLDGPLAARWAAARWAAARWAAARPKATRPLEAWAREFCDRRNSAAHGGRRRGARFVWSEEAHLAFTSSLFPLLVKQRLARDGFLRMAENDEIELAWIEAYLMHDPFESAANGRRQPHEHPWSRIYSENVIGEKLRRRLEEQMRGIDWNNLPEGG